MAIASSKGGEQYNILGVLERLKQEDTMALLKIAAKKYIQRVSVMWSSPLSDWNKVKSTNEFALSTFMYLMWTQTWPLAKLRQVNQRLRKISSRMEGVTKQVQMQPFTCQGALAEEA